MTTPVEKSTNPQRTPRPRRSEAPPPSQRSRPGTRAQSATSSDSYLQRVRGGEMGMLPALAGVVVIGIAVLLPELVLPHQEQHREPADPDGGADDARDGADVRDHHGRDRPVRRRHRRLRRWRSSSCSSTTSSWNWIVALVVALLVGASIGTFIGFFVAKIGVPSFVMTLALFLGLQGLMLVLLGDAGAYRIEAPAVLAIMNKSMPVWAGWLMLAVIVAISLLTGLYDRSRRAADRYAGPSHEPAVGTRRGLGSWRRIGRLHAEPEQVDRA